jgi:PleD family two-component response regulator
MDNRTRPGLLLVATESDWSGRSLESVLTVHGYSVLRTQDGGEALELVRRTRPDAVILDEHLPALSGIEVCSRLREDATFDAATPIVLIGSPTSPVERTKAYAAGVWTFCTQPLDAEILVGQLGTFIRAKRAVHAAREQSLVDTNTGLLSPSGIERWAEQLTAQAARNGEPLACVVLMAPTRELATDAEVEESAADFLEASRAHMRRSDIVGRMPDGRLAVLAPDTDEAGVEGLVHRLRSAIEHAEAANPVRRKSSEFRAGYFTISDAKAEGVAPSELLRRATVAVEYANHAPQAQLNAFNFRQLPIN